MPNCSKMDEPSHAELTTSMNGCSASLLRHLSKLAGCTESEMLEAIFILWLHDSVDLRGRVYDEAKAVLSVVIDKVIADRKQDQAKDN